MESSYSGEAEIVIGQPKEISLIRTETIRSSTISENTSSNTSQHIIDTHVPHILTAEDSRIVKLGRTNTPTILRAIFVYFEEKGILNNPCFNHQIFKKNNPFLDHNTTKKWKGQKGVKEMLKSIHERFGENPFERNVQIKWIDNGSLICLHSIPKSVLQQYCENPTSQRFVHADGRQKYASKAYRSRMYGNDKDVDGSQLAAMVLPEDVEGSNDSLNNSEYFGDHNIMSEDIIANDSNVQREDGNEDGNEMKDAVGDINTGSKRIRDDPTDSPAPLTQGSQPNAVNIRRLRSGNKEGTSSGSQGSPSAVESEVLLYRNDPMDSPAPLSELQSVNNQQLCELQSVNDQQLCELQSVNDQQLCSGSKEVTSIGSQGSPSTVESEEELEVVSYFLNDRTVEVFDLDHKVWANHIIACYNNLVFPEDCAELVLPNIINTLKQGPKRNPFVLMIYPYLQLQKQYQLCCWHHALSALISSPLNCYIRENDWLCGALIFFYEVDVEVDNLICNDEKKTTFVSASRDFLTPMTEVQLGTAVRLYIRRLKENLAMNYQQVSTCYSSDGMETISFHKVCSIMNGVNETFYLGALTLSPKECDTQARLLHLLLEHGANCAVIFSKIYKGSVGYHYTMCWVYGNDANALAFFDPIEGFEEPCIVVPQLTRRTFMQTKAGVIIGKGIPNRCLFLFNIPRNERNLETLPDVTNIIQSNYNHYLNRVFLKYLKLQDFGFDMDAQSFFHNYGRDKYTAFENHLIEVRESTLRNIYTHESVGLGAFATTTIAKDIFLDYIDGNVLVGHIEQLLNMPFTFLLHGIRKKISQRKAVDAYQSAKLGKCLIAYANFAGPGTYFFHGGTVVTTGHALANVEMVTEQGDRIGVKSIKAIRAGEEILFTLGEYSDFLPRADKEEAARFNMHLQQLPVYQAFRPDEVECVLTTALTPVDYDRALRYLTFLREKFQNGQTKEVLFTRCNIEFTVETMLRYYPRKLPNIPKRPLINKRTAFWANDAMITCWMYQLREIDRIMCEADPIRPKTLFIDPVIGLHKLIADKKWLAINKLYIKQRKSLRMSFVDYDRIIVPINEDESHWTIQTIFLNKRTIVYYNGYNSRMPAKDSLPSLLLDFVEYFSTLDRRLFDRSLWNVIQANTTVQVDTSECGFHIMSTMYMIIHDLPHPANMNMDIVRLKTMISAIDGRIPLHPASSSVTALDLSSDF